MSALSPQPNERRLAANRANAQLSTGPRTAAGKAISSVNAVKSGLTGRTVLLPSEDVAAYQSHVEHFRQHFHPVGPRETELVQSLADTQWRLNRIPNLEAGLFALGRLRYADLFADEKKEAVRAALLDAHILMIEEKHFKNLHLQENRLRRQYRQDAQELKELKGERTKKQEEREQKEAAQRAQPPQSKVAHATVSGFEFAETFSTTDTEGKQPEPLPMQTATGS